MKTLKVLATVAASVVFIEAGAQTADVAGRLMGQTYFDITDMLRFSQTNYTLGTARSSAMGGAFTSLGADLSTMSINPAGLGMYQSSDVGISLATTIARNPIKGLGTTVYNRDHTDTQVNLNNLSFAFNVYESGGLLTNLNIGFGYNRLANYNYSSSFEVRNETTSLSDVMLNQLYDMKADGVTQTMMNSSSDPFSNPNIFTKEWGSVLAYQTEAVYGETDGSFTLNRSMSDNATTNSLLTTHNTGGMGEYTMSVGGNISNYLYFGATLGIQALNYTEANYYEEAYNDNTVQYPINFLMYDQNVKVTGSGVNFKIGLTARPIEALRIGIAFHTPTLLSLTKSYSAAMRANFNEATGTNDVTKYTNTNTYTYHYSTAPRLLVGASYTFGDWAVLSADYERVWYNGMRLKNADADIRGNYKATIKNHYKGGDAVRVGVEVKPIQMLALRGGFGYQGSMLRHGTDDIFNHFDNTTAYKELTASAGIGVRFRTIYLDLSYVYNDITSSPFVEYYYYNSKGTYNRAGTLNAAQTTLTQYGRYQQQLKRHTIILSFGMRF